MAARAARNGAREIASSLKSDIDLHLLTVALKRKKLAKQMELIAEAQTEVDKARGDLKDKQVKYYFAGDRAVEKSLTEESDGEGPKKVLARKEWRASSPISWGGQPDR